MKKLISIILAISLCFSMFAIAASAEGEEVGRMITSIELHNVKYYQAVKTADKIADAAFFIDFVAYFDDGTTAEYNSKKGWNDPTVTSDVSWYIKPESEENFGDQQSLYVVVDGEEYWAGYVNVEVNKWKAIFRVVVTWDWVAPAVVKTANFFSNLFATIFAAIETLFQRLFSCFDSCKCPSLCEIFHCI